MLEKIDSKLKHYVHFDKTYLEPVEVGTALVYNLYVKDNHNYIPIVETGMIIDEQMYASLMSQQTLYIEFSDIKKANLNYEQLKRYIYFNRINPEYCIKLLYRVNDDFFDFFYNSKENLFNEECAISIVKSIILLVKYNRKFLKENISKLTNSNILTHHSLNVTIYAINLGKTLGLSESELQNLGLAAYLHDIGLKMIDETITAKNATLAFAELETVHKHPIYSVEIVKHNRIHNPYIIDAIKHHHENYDGTGYPDQLRAENIGVFASILSICDVFDALTSERPYRDYMSSYEALTYMMKGDELVGKFNHSYIKAFIKLLIDK